MYEFSICFIVTLFDDNNLTIKDLYKTDKDNVNQFLGEDVDFEALNHTPGTFHIYFTISDFDIDYFPKFMRESSNFLYNTLFPHYQVGMDDEKLNIEITRTSTMKHIAGIEDEEIREMYAEGEYIK